MRELFQDTAMGFIVRTLSRGKLLSYAEERDPSLWKKYVSPEKSKHMAQHGSTEPEHNDDDAPPDGSGDPQRQGENRDVESGVMGDDNANARSGFGEEEMRTNTQAGSRNEANTEAGSRNENTDTEENLRNVASGEPVDPEKGRDVSVVTWYSDDDPANPRNWSPGKKNFVAFLICLLTFSVYIGSAIYSAGTMDIMATFGVSEVAATLGLTLFVAGYGLGPMIWSPMSEIPQIGRNPIYILTLFVFVFLQFAVVYAKNFGMLLAFRFLTGFFGSPILATGGASLSDMYKPSKRPYALGIWGLAAICGPVLGPLIGGFAAQHETWKWPIWELLWLSGFALIVLFFTLPETSGMNIMYRRARRLRKLSGVSSIMSESELMAEQMSAKEVALMVLVRPFSLNFLEPIVLALNLYIALIYGLLYVWFESFAIVFIQTYGFNLGLEGVAFVGILVGGFVIIVPFFIYVYKVQEPQFNENGEIKPEKRLPPACVGAFFIPVCLFWFGWTSRPAVHWISPIIASSFFSMGAFLLFNSVLNYLADAYPAYAASVYAANDFMRSSFGAGFPLFANAMYMNLGTDWATSTLGFLSVAFVPIPFVLYIYGERIRMHSKRARHDL